MNDGYGVWEIYPGLILGSLWNYRELMGLKPNVLVVLDRLPESVWDDGFSGERSCIIPSGHTAFCPPGYWIG